MLRPLSNLLFRHQDPTRLWPLDPSQLIVDLRRCTLAGTPLGSQITNLPLGPSHDARAAARGYPQWPPLGLHCTLENHRLADFTLLLIPSGRFRPFPGTLLNDATPIQLSSQTTIDQLLSLLGPPFAQSHNDWDDATILFYEHDTGEVQYAFDKSRATLDSLEFWFEPELSQPRACQTYGIQTPFPSHLRRSL